MNFTIIFNINKSYPEDNKFLKPRPTAGSSEYAELGWLLPVPVTKTLTSKRVIKSLYSSECHCLWDFPPTFYADATRVSVLLAPGSLWLLMSRGAASARTAGRLCVSMCVGGPFYSPNINDGGAVLHSQSHTLPALTCYSVFPKSAERNTHG